MGRPFQSSCTRPHTRGPGAPSALASWAFQIKTRWRPVRCFCADGSQGDAAAGSSTGASAAQPASWEWVPTHANAPGPGAEALGPTKAKSQHCCVQASHAREESPSCSTGYPSSRGLHAPGGVSKKAAQGGGESWSFPAPLSTSVPPASPDAGEEHVGRRTEERLVAPRQAARNRPAEHQRPHEHGLRIPYSLAQFTIPPNTDQRAPC